MTTTLPSNVLPVFVCIAVSIMLWSRFLTQTLISAPFSDTIFDHINTRANYIPFCPCSFLLLGDLRRNSRRFWLVLDCFLFSPPIFFLSS
ncbi:hypothetical protein BKA82DRAFT_4120128, partial [Pisolithus tinctorius]